jgi:small-conductance mechanosensitive channel
MTDLWARLHELLELPPDLQARLLQSGVIILLLVVLRSAVLRIVTHRTTDVRTRYHWRKTSAYVAAVVATFLVGRTWFEGVGAIATYLGLVSAGLVVALRDLIVDIAGWVFIVSRRPFSVGDRIQLGEHAGDVIDQRIFQFTLLEIGNWVDADQSTGRIVHVPNGLVFTNAIANYTRGFQHLWNEIPVRLSFESNWEKAKEILKDIANRHAEPVTAGAEAGLREAARQFMIVYPTLTPTVYTSVREWGVLLTVRYLCPPRGRRASTEAVWESILREFAGHNDIEFAYPTQRFYDRAAEREAGEPMPATSTSLQR